MKKSLYILAAAAIVAGCSSNDLRNEVVKEEAPIGFSKVYIEKGTKAAFNQLSDFEKANNTFGVFGYKTVSSTTTKVFGEREGEGQGVKVTFGTDWTYTPLRYWDRVASSYSFYAYAPHSDSFTGTVALASNSSNAFSITGFEQKDVQADMIDLMVDLTSQKSVTGNNIGKNDVEFTFNHILSSINFKMAVSADLKNDESKNPVTVVSVSVGAIKLDGTYDDPDNDDELPYAWTIKDESRTKTFEATKTSGNVFASGVLKANSAAITGGGTLATDKVGLTDVPGLTDLLFIPQDVADDYEISITYKIENEEFSKTLALSDFTKTVDEEEVSLEAWQSGYKYTYVLIIGPTPILFDVKDNFGWGDGGTYTYTIQ